MIEEGRFIRKISPSISIRDPVSIHNSFTSLMVKLGYNVSQISNICHQRDILVELLSSVNFNNIISQSASIKWLLNNKNIVLVYYM